MKSIVLLIAGLAVWSSVSGQTFGTQKKQPEKQPEKKAAEPAKQFGSAAAPATAFPSLPKLAYAFDALEPGIDKATMEVHYTKHFQTYYNNYLKAVQGTPAEKMKTEDLFRSISKFPEAVRNNAGGYYNHSLYFANMTPGGGKPEGKLLDAIMKQFGSYDEFVKQFTEAGKNRFGSGWAWLSLDKAGKLFISSTPNQDNPLMEVADKQGTPLLAMDVWEHAYYLKYQNRRADYIDAFMKVINWKEVEFRYRKALGQD